MYEFDGSLNEQSYHSIINITRNSLTKTYNFYETLSLKITLNFTNRDNGKILNHLLSGQQKTVNTLCRKKRYQEDKDL